MAPRKQYIARKDLHINIEADIKNIGDEFGLVPKDVLKNAYIFLINHHIERYGAPNELKVRWKEVLSRDLTTLHSEIETAKELERLYKQSINHQIIETPKSILLTVIIPLLSPDELQWVIRAAKSDHVNIVRSVIPKLKTIYEARTGKIAPYWTPDDEMEVLNHLIDLGGM